MSNANNERTHLVRSVFASSQMWQALVHSPPFFRKQRCVDPRIITLCNRTVTRALVETDPV